MKVLFAIVVALILSLLLVSYANATQSDIHYVDAKGYDFKVFLESTEIATQSYPILHVSICPSPNISSNAGFVDPDTGILVDKLSGSLVTFYFTQPNGTITDLDDRGEIPQWGLYPPICSNNNNSTRYEPLHADIPGNWTVNAVAKWISNGTLYRMRSDIVSFHVLEPQFPAKITKIVNMTSFGGGIHYDPGRTHIANATYFGGGIDISPDKKFIIFSVESDINVESCFITSNESCHPHYENLWMVHPDGTGLQQVDMGKTFHRIMSPKISPSGDLILWSGAYNDSNAPHNGLFVFDIRENKLVQISYENLDTLSEFHWTQDNKIAYIDKNAGLVIDDAEGNIIKKTQTSDLSSIDLYREPNHLGSMTVTAQNSGCRCDAGFLSIKSSTDGYEEKIFDSTTGTPAGAAISSDGKTIVFAYPEGAIIEANMRGGVYLAMLDKSVTEYKPAIPEFPINLLALMSAFAGYFVLTRYRKGRLNF